MSLSFRFPPLALSHFCGLEKRAKNAAIDLAMTPFAIAMSVFILVL